MIPTTHTLLALALLSKRGEPKRNWVVAFGSFLPDLAISIWAPYQTLVNKVDGRTLWNHLYFEPPMQNLIAYFNSIPIYAALAMTGYVLREKVWGKLLLILSLAALTHIATDFPVHNHDAYRHFWPLSDWRYFSPYSYYEVDFHSKWVSLVEAVIALGSAFILWRRFPKIWSRYVLGLIAIYYIFKQTQNLIG